MFSPEKISPDSLLEGKYMQDGMFVFFICSLSLHRLFLHPSLPPPLLCDFMMNPFPPCTLVLHLLHLFISVCLFLTSYSALLFILTSLLFPSCCNLSALYPVVEESRLGLSSVSGKVALQLAACPTRGPSLPGLVTRNSVLLRPQPQHKALVGSGQLGRLLKVNARQFNQFYHANTITTFESRD